MSWLALALIPPVVWAMGSVIDKVLVEKFIRDGIGAGILTNVASGLLPLALSLAIPLALPPLPVCAAIMGAGVLWGAGRITYCVGMAKEEASRVVPLIQVNPLLILLVSWVLFGAKLSVLQAAGFALVFSGAMLISVRRIEGSFRFSPAMPWLVANNIFIAAAFLILKQFSQVRWWDALFLISIGFVLSAILFVPLGRGLAGEVRRMGRARQVQAMILIALLCCLIIAGRAAFYAALELAPAAVVSVLAATSSVFILGFTVLISWKAPGILREEFSRKTFGLKALAMVLVIAGIASFAFA